MASELRRISASYLPAARLICAVLLGAAMAGAATNAPVTLRLWGIPNKTTTDPISVATRRCFEVFVKRHPEINVKAVVPLKIQGPAQEGSEFLAVAGGVAPDVFVLFGRKISDYDNQGFLYPLNAYLASYARTHGRPYAGIGAPAAVWELCLARTNVICVPLGYYSMALMCRRDLFNQAGVPLRAPADWDELYRMARSMTRLPDKEPDAKPGDLQTYGLRLLTSNFAGWQLLQYVWSAGAEVVRGYYPLADGRQIEVPSPPINYRAQHIQISNQKQYAALRKAIRAQLAADGVTDAYSYTDLEWRLTVNEPGGVAALRFYRRLIHQPWLRIDGVEFDLTPAMLRAGVATIPGTSRTVNLRAKAIRDRIYHGVVLVDDGSQQDLRRQYAMQIGTLTEVAANNANDAAQLVALPFPSLSNGVPPAAFIAGHYLGINATQRDRRVRDAAWQYIAFMTGREAQRIRAETFVEFGLAEFIRPATLAALDMQPELRRIPAERLALWNMLNTHAKTEPYCRGFQHVMTRELGKSVDAMLGDRPTRKTHYEYRRNPQRVLDDICTRVNNRIMGRMSAAEVRRRSLAGWLIAAGILGLLAVGVYTTIRMAVRLHAASASLEGYGVGGMTVGRMVAIVIFLAPAVATIVLWRYYPLAIGSAMAFQDYRIIGTSAFVGLRNFIETAAAPEFWRYVLHTFLYLFYSLSLGFGAPIILAILLHEVPKGKVLFRTIYYLPAVTTGLVTMFLWKQLLFDPTPSGLINQCILAFNVMPPWLAATLRGSVALAGLLLCLGCSKVVLRRDVSGLGRLVPAVVALALLAWLGYEARALLRATQSLADIGAWFAEPFEFQAQQFLQDPKLALLWVVIPGIWAGAGPGCLIYLAALKGVPDEQYEAADLDGAGLWSKLTNVTFPNLSALILINFVGAVVGAMQASQNIFVMTGGGPEDKTVTVGLSIWYNAFMYLNFGMATAQAWILGAMLVGFTLYQLRMMNRMQFRTTAAK